MFPKLRRQMTVFCTLVTESIFLALSLTCLFFAQNSIRQNSNASFLQELGTLLTNLQGQDVISHQWLNQLQEDHHLAIYLYDNGRPLYYQNLRQQTAERSDIPSQVMDQAYQNYGPELFRRQETFSPQHEEFFFETQDGTSYYVSVGMLPKGGGTLDFVILYPLASQQLHLFWLRLVMVLANAAAFLVLLLFSWIFTGRMLRPLEESRMRQNRFLAAASHELRSPLAVILSGLDALEKADTPAEQQHFSGLIRAEGGRMRRLISDMLLLAGSDSGSLQLNFAPHQADDLLLTLYESYELLAGKKEQKLRLRLPEESIPDCYCDREYLLQLLSILLDNAIAYTPSGGRLLLFLEYAPRGRHLPGPVFRFGVSDSGRGIPDEEKKQIFQRFYRVQQSRSEKEHFGLGLGIAAELTAAHHGRIWVEDVKTGGSTFLAELPAKT